MTALRSVVTAVLVVVAVIVQVSLFTHASIDGVVPDVALVVVIGVALVRGPEHGAVVGLLAGLLVDLTPPADHTAGRWALSFVVAGYLAGAVREDADDSPVVSVAVMAGCSFVAASVFALSGLALGDGGITVSRVFSVLPVEVVYTTAVAIVVLPAVMWVQRRLDSVAAREVAW